MTYTVYKHTSPSNKVYIGITRKNILKRWKGGRGYFKNTHFYNAILKYGWDNFKHEILFSELSEEEAKRKEIELIAKYNSTDPNFGYNITKGGDYRACMSEETKAKIKNKLRGIKRTEEQKLRYKEAALKRPKKQFLSEETKLKISKSLIGNKRALGKDNQSKKVAKYTLDGEFIRLYKNALEAARELGCCSSGINCACRENKKENINTTKYKGRYKGYKWYYA